MKNEDVRAHQNCRNYCKGIHPMIQAVDFTRNTRLNRQAKSSVVCFMVKGTVRAQIGGETLRLKAGDMFLLPHYQGYNALVEEDSRLVIFRIRFSAHFCDNFNLKELGEQYLSENDKNISETAGFARLDTHQRLGQFLDLQQGILSDGLRCKLLMEIKIQELFFLLRAYYEPDQLAQFFRALLVQDAGFHANVMNNWMKVSNVEQLALICNYSASGFIKHFKRVFNESPYRWIKARKGEQIVRDIQKNSLTDREICEKYDFNALPYFYTFCKREYGLSPGKIRAADAGMKQHVKEMDTGEGKSAKG